MNPKFWGKEKASNDKIEDINIKTGVNKMELKYVDKLPEGARNECEPVIKEFLESKRQFAEIVGAKQHHTTAINHYFKKNKINANSMSRKGKVYLVKL